MSWRIALAGRAAKDLDGVPSRGRQAIERTIGRQPADPGQADIKKLRGSADMWRLRVGRWRVLLKLDTAAGLITVTRVLPRDRAYRD